MTLSTAPSKSKFCVYCGSSNPSTHDHIPPKNLFPKPRPHLLTVPCCAECNASASKDDEYFGLMITLRHDTGEDPTVQKLWPALIRSLERPKGSGFARALFESVAPVDITSPGGLYLGRGTGYSVNHA